MKTIVYLTINTINKKIYIGIHDTDTDKFDGYLGNGVYDNDKSSYEHCKTPFEYAVKIAYFVFSIFCLFFSLDVADKNFGMYE